MKTLKFQNNPYIIKNKGYSTIEFNLVFDTDYKKEDLLNWNLIRQIILNSSNKYKQEKEFIKQKRKLMIIYLGLNYLCIGDKRFIVFNLTVPDPKKIKSFDLEKAFEFFLDTIYNPNIINNEFNHQRFKRELEYLKKTYQNQNDNHNTIAENEFFDIIDDIGYLKENMYHNMELIEKANPKDLYHLYKKSIINNKNPLIAIYGDIDESINKLIYKHIKYNNEQRIIKIKNDKYYKPFKNKKEINTKSENNQSFLYLSYKAKNMKKEYKDYLILLRNILGTGSNSLVHNTLRYEHKLLYYHTVPLYSDWGLLYIGLSIENDKKDIAVNAINEIFKKLHNKKFLKECINKTIKDFEAKIREAEDSKNYKLNIFINRKFGFNTDKKFLNKIKKIDLDKYIEFLNNLENDTIFFKEGEYGEK